MSLSGALSSYKSNLEGSYSNKNNTPILSATDFANFTKNWAEAGVPMIKHIGIAPVKGLVVPPPQAVASFMTADPGNVTADGDGGIDSDSPGAGLAAVKSVLIASLILVFSNNSNSESDAADGVTQAVNDYFSQAKIMTNVTGVIPPGVPVPAPSGPVGPGNYTGTGIGGVDARSPGSGWSVAKTAFINSVKSVYENTNNTPAQTAQGIADACEAFFLAAKVDTVDTGSAGGGPATVDSGSGSGATNPPGSNIISGQSSSGALS
jgi:hypothetical protein